MATTSIYQRFLQVVWKRLKRDYPFVSRFDKAFDVAIPKSSSFLIGRSPQNGKYYILDFQHNSKPWAAGKFTINVHVSSELAPTSRWTAFSGYDAGDDGYYRLASVVLGYDKWWCLKDRDRSLDAQMREVLPTFDPDQEDQQFFKDAWRPTTFDSEETVIQGALEDTFALLEHDLFVRFGFSAATSCSDQEHSTP